MTVPYSSDSFMRRDINFNIERKMKEIFFELKFRPFINLLTTFNGNRSKIKARDCTLILTYYYVLARLYLSNVVDNGSPRHLFGCFAMLMTAK